MGNPVKRIPVLDQESLSAGSVKSFALPVGDIITKMLLRFHVKITIGTGTGALAEALARIVENILITTSKDGIICNAAGRWLYRRAQIMGRGTLPVADTFAAASATYLISLPIHFADELTAFPTKSALDLRRSKTASIQLGMGGLTRLLSSVGSAVLDELKVTLVLEAVDGELPAHLAPEFAPYLVTKSPVDPNSGQKVELESEASLAIKRIFILTTNDNTAAYQGNADSAVISQISVKDNRGFLGFQDEKDDIIQRNNVTDYGIDGGSIIAGQYVLDYCLSGDIDDALVTAGRSEFQLKWTNDTPAGKQVHTAIDGVKLLM